MLKFVVFAVDYKLHSYSAVMPSHALKDNFGYESGVLTKKLLYICLLILRSFSVIRRISKIGGGSTAIIFLRNLFFRLTQSSLPYFQRKNKKGKNIKIFKRHKIKYVY